MKRIVEKAIPNIVFNADALKTIIDTVLPLLREIRRVVNGRFGQVSTVMTDYTMTELDEVVLANSTGGAFSVYLQPVVQCTKTVIVKRIGASNVTIKPNADDSGVLIDGAASVTLTTIYDVMQLVSDGYNWHVVSAG